MNDLKVSVAIAALNEGPDLEVTIASMLAGARPVDEIVLVDDCSLEDVRPRLIPWIDAGKVRVIRNSVRAGPGPSKHEAVGACRGDLVIVSDSHMRVGHDWLKLLLEEHAENPCAVLCPASRGFEHDGAFHAAGAKFEMGEHGFWEPKWLSPKPNRKRAYVVPCVMGGMYAVPRAILSAIGGYCPRLVGYGCEEEWLSLRAWVCGFEVRAAPRVIALHHFGHNLNRASACGSPEQPDTMGLNRAIIAESLFPGRYALPRTDDAIRAISGTPLSAVCYRGFGDLCRLTGITHSPTKD